MSSSQIIISDSSSKQISESQIKGKNLNNVKNKHRKKMINNIKGKEKEKKGLTKEEKNFLALLVQNMLEIKKMNKKGMKNIKGKQTGGEKLRKNIKNNKNLKIKEEGKEIKTKKTDKATFNLIKNKDKKVKGDIQKIALDNLKNGDIKGKNSNKKNIEKTPDIKTDILKGGKEKSKFEKVNPDVSKVEQIKINPQTKEVKLELIKQGNIKQNSNKAGVNKSSIIDEIVNIVQNNNSKGSKIFRIHLDPPDLGKVYIKLTFSTDKKLDMKIYVQKTDVQHYLNSGIEHLKTSVENLGFKFDNPVIQTMSEFNAGSENRDGKEKGEKMKKIRFKVVSSPFDDNELKEEYLQVMDYLSGRVDIRV
jgi:flagellar hook-length control protein FliK